MLGEFCVVFGKRWAILGSVTASNVDEPGYAEKFILRALVISVLLHLLVFFTYRIGRTQGWWANMVMPHWMQVVSRAL